MRSSFVEAAWDGLDLLLDLVIFDFSAIEPRNEVGIRDGLQLFTLFGAELAHALLEAPLVHLGKEVGLGLA